MSDVRAELTEFGFIFGAAEVERSTAVDGSVCITVKSDAGPKVRVYVSPQGRSIRVFKDGAELKLEASSLEVLVDAPTLVDPIPEPGWLARAMRRVFG